MQDLYLLFLKEHILNNLKKFIFVGALAMYASTGFVAFAQQTAATAAQAEMSDGEIKKVDMEGGKFTIKHGELKNLGMPGMTMVFRAKDPVMLEQVKQGDRVRFVAEKLDGALTVTVIEKAI
jgi:Cu(I)/Ag(I) efflux system protein CusF